MSTTISERIKKGLEIRHMKQSELVEKTGIGKSSISTYLSGAYEPKQRNIYKIAKALDVNEAWLMGLDVPMERVPHYVKTLELSNDEFELLNNYKKLNNLGKDKLIEYSNDLTETPKYIENVKNEINTNIEDEFTIAKKKSHEARINAEQRFKESPDSLPKASHDKHGSFTDEEYKHDDDIMNDDDFWNK